MCRSPSLAVLVLLLNWSTVAAVTSEDQSERLQIIHGHLLDYRWAQAPERPKKDSWNIIGELLWMPRVDNTVGTKQEPIDSPPAIPRPRVQFLSAQGMFAGGSWLPPLEVKGFKANLLNLEAGYIYSKGLFNVGGRAAFSAGHIKGPITDPELKDLFQLQRYNADAVVSYHIENLLRLFFGGGTGSVNSALHITEDGVVLRLKGHRYLYAFAGATYPLTESIRLSFQQQQSQSFLNHWSVSASYQF